MSKLAEHGAVGESWFDHYEDSVLERIYRSDTKEFNANFEEELKEDFLDENNFFETDLFFNEDGDILNQEEAEEMICDRGLQSEAEIKARVELHKKIADALSSMTDINGKPLDLNNLILSDGSVYNGAGDCETYIQATHAWCSSSMSC